MNWLSAVILLSCVFFSLQISTPQDDHYVAAVVEYIVNRNVDTNRENYVRMIEEAADQNADILVFPELTLTNSTLSFPVPFHGLLKDYPIPSLRSDLYHELLVAISAAARENQIYVLINVRELMNCTEDTGEYCPDQRQYIFNTNVVFDRTGAVIDRYRKINLFGEFTHTPALSPDLGVFTTDFGVTFGHFICFDLKFQIPAIQIVQRHNITDIAFNAMWISELPYLNAVQIMEGYAYALNVNFLGAGANNVFSGSAGSGIFSGRAGALISLMPGVSTTRLLVAKVPKIPGQVTEKPPGPIYNAPEDHDSLLIWADPSLPAHTTRRLVQGRQEFTLVNKDVTCTFRIRLNRRNGDVQYSYRAGAFSGVRTYSGFASAGTRICSIMACTGDTIDTCGRRFSRYTANSTAVFEELNIIGTVPTPVRDPLLMADDSTFFPVSSLVSILPLEPQDYSYSSVVNGNTTTHTLSLNNHEAELYGFALWGRDFTRDGLEPDLPIEEDDSVEPEYVEESEGTEDLDDLEDLEVPDSTPGAGISHVLSPSLLLLALKLFL